MPEGRGNRYRPPMIGEMKKLAGSREGVLMQDRADIIVESSRAQLEYFTQVDSRCRGVQLPEGVMLRYVSAKSLFFYLRTGLHDGKIVTHVYATDSPYDMQKCCIGAVTTALFDLGSQRFDPLADQHQVSKLENFLNAWVEFIGESTDDAERFSSFHLDPRLTQYAR